MPELSFEDLLDDSPVKKAMGLVDDDPLGLEDERPVLKNDTLNTPGPKKPPQQYMKQQQHATLITTTQHMKQTASTMQSNQRNVIGNATTVAKTATPDSSSGTTPILLNNKNILPKSASASGNGGGQFMRVAQKTGVTGGATLTRSPATSAATTTTTFSGKTAIKTPSGQIIYIQKKSTAENAVAGSGGAGSGGVTMAGSRLTTSTGTAPNTTPAAGGNNTPITFKLMRTADGRLVHFKSTNATTTSTTASKTLSLSPKVTTQLATSSSGAGAVNKRIITTSGGQVVIHTTPTSAGSTNANRPASTTATASTTSTTYRLQQQVGVGATTTIQSNNQPNTSKGPSAPGSQKILLRTSSGKQILVSNQQLIKLSPTPSGGATPNSTTLSTTTNSKTSSNTTTNSNSNARQLQAIQLPGKPVQYLRVVPKGRSNADGTIITTTSAATSIASSVSAAAASTTSNSSSAATSTIKILNAAGVPPKFAVVRPGTTGSAAKLILTQSPKKEGAGVPVTFSPITSKVQKTIVTLPQLRPLSDGQRISHSATNTNTTSTSSHTISSTHTNQMNSNTSNTTQTFIKRYPSATTNATEMANNPLLRKHKISEINTELKRMTTAVEESSSAHDSGMDATGLGPPETKKLAAGGRIVMLPRSMLRNTPEAQMRKVPVQSGVVGGGVDNNKNGPMQQRQQQQQQQQQQQGQPQQQQYRSQQQQNQIQQQQNQIQQQNQQQQMQSVLKNNNSLITTTTTDTSGQKSLLLSGKTNALIAQQHQQQQQKLLQLKRQIQQEQLQQQQQQQKQQLQLEQQIDNKYGINKLPVLAREAGSNNNNSNNNTNGSSNTNNNSDSSLLNFKIKLEPMDEVRDIKPNLDELASDAANGGIRRKHCNCSKSQCLKLYCDCFANGEFCQDCTCKDCFNNLQYEDQRQRAIKNCLERNPSAFKPKITTSHEQGDMRHNKGCNCKRSGCLKNYCECYEAKIPCSSNCKCVGCRNIEERPDLDMDPIDPKLLASIAAVNLQSAAGHKRSYDKANNALAGFGKDNAKALSFGSDLLAGLAGAAGSMAGSSGSGSNAVAGTAASAAAVNEKQQCNFITQEVVDATIQCMISQADECEKNGLPSYQTEKMVMEEMGRCLVEIIDFSIRNTDSSFTQE